MKDAIDAILRRSQAEYLDRLLPDRDPLLERIETFAREEQQPIADPEVAQLMRVLLQIRRPKRLLEVGTNIGYSVIVMGRELGQDSVIETIEIDRPTLEIARRFVREAALLPQVIFHEGAALEVLPRLSGPFDFIFIDCVKVEYWDYLEAILPHCGPGAVIVYDNLLWKGRVAREEHDAATDALRDFNSRVTRDPRLLTTILPVGDGTGVSIVV